MGVVVKWVLKICGRGKILEPATALMLICLSTLNLFPSWNLADCSILELEEHMKWREALDQFYLRSVLWGFQGKLFLSPSWNCCGEGGQL